MTNETQEKLAGSLTAETTELIPFLPYLLQDFWELGAEPNIILGLIKEHVDLPENAQILDLACGKGAVSVRIAERLQAKVKGVDLIPEFVEYAKQKANEHSVSGLCEFVVQDINEAVKKETGYDVVILGAVGNVLGSPLETLVKLKETIKTGGYILIDDGYLEDDAIGEDIKYNNYEYLTRADWDNIFKQAGLELVKAATEFEDTENHDSDSGMKLITQRANELMLKHPDKKEMFEGYIKSQQDEYDDLDTSIAEVTWILKKL